MHILALALSFGTILVVDWLGLLWLLGKVEIMSLSIAPAMHRLLASPPRTRFGELTQALRLRLMIALSISQACGWTAVLIGLINSTLRRWA